MILPIPIGRSPDQKICCYQHLWSLHLKPAAKAFALWAIPRRDVYPRDLSTSQAQCIPSLSRPTCASVLSSHHQISVGLLQKMCRRYPMVRRIKVNAGDTTQPRSKYELETRVPVSYRRPCRRYHAAVAQVRVGSSHPDSEPWPRYELGAHTLSLPAGHLRSATARHFIGTTKQFPVTTKGLPLAADHVLQKPILVQSAWHHTRIFDSY